MRIIRATAVEIPRIMECAREFCAVLGVKLNELHYAQAWLDAFENQTGVIFLLEDNDAVVGGIGGIKANDLLSGDSQAVELFWYVKEIYRHGMWPMRLLAEFERWAKESGCVSVNMIHMEKSMPQHMKAVYSRLGYELIETVHTKSLCNQEKHLKPAS